VALIIDAVTDNPTRTVADVRHKMSRGGGNLGMPNSVAFMFEKKGLLTIPVAKHADEDAILEAALEAGAEDFRREDEDSYVVTTDPASFHAVMSALEAKGIIASEAELAMVPKTTVMVTGDDVESLLKLIESIEELDDVQKVWANFDIDDADLATL
jgi:YebC/PmpR family DNA-binding regulatory protein